MIKIKRAVFPVAGFGTRFLPVTKTQPKEMLPIVDKPVIHYLVEEAVNSGIEEIIIVTGRGKRAIEDYFDQSFELQHTLVETGKHELLQEVLEIPNLARFIYVRQALPKGDGDAIMKAYSLLKDEPFAVMFGDDLVMSGKPALRQLIDKFEETGLPVVALTEVKDSEVSSYGIVEIDASSNIKAIVEKPTNRLAAPSNWGIIGKYIITPEILEVLRTQQDANSSAELRLADALLSYVNSGGIITGHAIEGTRYDTGTKLGFLKATLDYALNRPELKSELLEYIRSK